RVAARVGIAAVDDDRLLGGGGAGGAGAGRAGGRSHAHSARPGTLGPAARSAARSRHGHAAVAAGARWRGALTAAADGQHDGSQAEQRGGTANTDAEGSIRANA